MAETKTAKKRSAESAKSTADRESTTTQWTAEELAAMKEHGEEMKRARRSSGGDADGERDVLAKIAGLPEPDRAKAERVHAIVKSVAPELTSRTWYGMPAYAKDGTVICFFQDAHKFKSRYAMLGFGDKAKLDDGDMWPTYFALNKMTPNVETKIAELIKKAVS